MWRGSETTHDDVERIGLKPGPAQELSLIDQFFLVTVRTFEKVKIVLCTPLIWLSYASTPVSRLFAQVSLEPQYAFR